MSVSRLWTISTLTHQSADRRRQASRHRTVSSRGLLNSKMRASRAWETRACFSHAEAGRWRNRRPADPSSFGGPRPRARRGRTSPRRECSLGAAQRPARPRSSPAERGRQTMPPRGPQRSPPKSPAVAASVALALEAHELHDRLRIDALIESREEQRGEIIARALRHETSTSAGGVVNSHSNVPSSAEPVAERTRQGCARNTRGHRHAHGWLEEQGARVDPAPLALRLGLELDPRVLAQRSFHRSQRHHRLGEGHVEMRSEIELALGAWRNTRSGSRSR